MLACPCCGHLTLSDEAYGSWEICEICFWEDDPVQLADPMFGGGANKPSLAQAQLNVAEFGATERRFVADVKSAKPHPRDRAWRPFDLVNDRRINRVPDFIAPYWIEL